MVGGTATPVSSSQYRDVGDQISDGPDVGSFIFLGLDRYRVIYRTPTELTTGGTDLAPRLPRVGVGAGASIVDDGVIRRQPRRS